MIDRFYCLAEQIYQKIIGIQFQVYALTLG